MLFEKSGNFIHRVNIEVGLTPPQYVFVHILRTPSPTLHKGRTLKEMEGVHDIAGAFMHLEEKEIVNG